MSDSLQYLTDDQGQRTAVVLPISEYEKLLEDLDDLAVVAERRDEPTIPHHDFIADLKLDGNHLTFNGAAPPKRTPAASQSRRSPNP